MATREKRRNALTLTNVLLVVKSPEARSILGSGGEDLGQSEGVIENDWRTLRDRLIPIFLKENPARSDEADWLRDAGYLIRTKNGDYSPTPDLITDEIEGWLFHWSVLIGWGMDTFDPRSAPQQKKRFAQYLRRMCEARRHGLPAPETETLFEDLGGAPEYPKIELWEEFLSGMGTVQPLRSTFSMHSSTQPVIEIVAGSPMHAVSLTVFIDRVFTQRELGRCKWCGQMFTKHGHNQMFCPPILGRVSHQSLWKTRFRRDKVKATREVMAETRKNWNKVAALATTKMKASYPKEPTDKLVITAQWAKNEMMKGAKKR